MRARGIIVAILALLVAAAPAAAAPTAQVRVTTPDGAMRFADGGSVAFAPGGSDELTISVDPSRAYQRWTGSARRSPTRPPHVLYRLDRRRRDAAMRTCSAATGTALLLRQPMGSSDFVAGEHYTYDDVPAGRTDYRMRHFCIAHDRARSCRCCARRCGSTRS